MSGPFFEPGATDGDARCGVLRTDHGDIQTPVFMPVGTAGTVKGLSAQQLRELGAGIILGNTYHLYLRPGHELVAQLGGLHRFMAWDGALLTDSGGFQVFSLEGLRKVDDDGVDFRSHLDGSRHRFTPEHSMDVQVALGADIIMAFDECPPLPSPPGAVATAVDRTLAWAGRCLDHVGPEREHAAGHRQRLFGIVQGGLDDGERERCAQALVGMGFPGYAIGGLSVGEEKAELHRVAQLSARLLPRDKPRYLMGVGFAEDILAAVQGGVDMFDCVLPTRMARHGTLLTRDGRCVLRNRRFADDPRPVEEDCPCLACRQHSRAYLRHLVMANELLGHVLCTLHNLQYFQRLMQGTREAIAGRRLAAFAADWIAREAAHGGKLP